jgi:SAM-dependent methyltransferase/uncharacterized protein YbaR (Trm112 family)
MPPSGKDAPPGDVMDKWLLANLVCPREHGSLSVLGSKLICPAGHAYPVIKGVPVMILDDVEQTVTAGSASSELAQLACQESEQKYQEDYFLDTLWISAENLAGLKRAIETAQFGEVDPVVRYLVSHTCGKLYRPLVGRLSTYPIPELRLPEGRGELLLDLGCSWGRWSVAASRKGYQPIGVDPSLGAVLAARRVCNQIGAQGIFVAADARYLPFRSGLFDVVFSYSVLQHFSKDDVKIALREAARVLKEEGTSLIQMANALGLRSLQLQMRRRFREGRGFEVRYWTLPELRRTFSQLLGPSSVSAEAYGGLGIQRSDIRMLTPARRMLVHCSELLRKLSTHLPWMRYFADSLYVRSIRRRA